MANSEIYHSDLESRIFGPFDTSMFDHFHIVQKIINECKIHNAYQKERMYQKLFFPKNDRLTDTAAEACAPSVCRGPSEVYGQNAKIMSFRTDQIGCTAQALQLYRPQRLLKFNPCDAGIAAWPRARWR